ncbi:MAG: bifunctional UDP-N-acetylmuramoyl-tripeptide:D-alanyl-D-alanine ligase/alanine racemase [Bacteroidales bacterium]|nr:bifunctional UDP-N-acetylmuramoyl-tripeptide:D-alanyl-D-alanine ligase/alanine racemase [Bacteroidales bacterium]
MLVYKIEKINDIISGNLNGNGKSFIKYLATDSRNIISPDESLFFALTGERYNGHNFIEELYKQGVRNFVVSSIPVNYSDFKFSNFILVENTLLALHKLCSFHRSQFKIPVIGITGSNGKTIIKEWLYQMLAEDKKTVKSPKSYNSQIGVPLSVWLLDNIYEVAIFEAGISLPGEMEKLQKIIQPNIGIFTNIGNAHQENFTSLEQKTDEKLKLFYNCEILIYCKDHKIIDDKINETEILKNTKIYSWSKNQNANLEIKQIIKKSSSTEISGIYKSKKINIKIPFIDNASIENAIHVWLLLLLFDNETKLIEKRMKSLSPIAMRLELKEGINNCTIINDCYNSDIESINIALDFLKQQKQHKKYTIILSDILQSGLPNSILYRNVAKLVNKKKINRIIGIGESISANSNLFFDEKVFFNTTDEFLNKFDKSSFNNEAILLKGSRQFTFEKISVVLQKKSHRTVLEINLNALTHNLNYFRSKLKPKTKIMAMVKALSYGSGTFEIANLLQHQNVDYLGVAFVDEGINLRENGITTPILVMNPEEQAFKSMIEYDLEPEIYNFRILELFNETLNLSDKNSYPVHIKIDTGMHRLGFIKDDIPQLINYLINNQRIKIKSVFSHLAGGDEEMHDTFTKQQFDKFEEISEQIKQNFNYPIITHILNSSGIERFPEKQYEMIRLGIGLYGISSTNQDKLHNVSSLKSHILQIKQVSNSDTIGYSRKGIVTRDSIIATIPIGYADGLSRQLSNGKGKVLINGKFAPIIGNICMDMCMVDITDIEASEGDMAIFFSDDYPITKMAKQLNTIPYEILTSISSRVKRVYYHE